MKRALAAAAGCLFAFQCVTAQSKVFKEVNDEISSQVKIISQDEALVGYLVFTQLERANEDSFNYKITIMDENLNDIGTVNFREENLLLNGVSFEQDMLCLAYFKSTVAGKDFSSIRAFKKAIPNAKNAVFTQVLNLQGKILATHQSAVNVDIDENDFLLTSTSGKGVASVSLKHRIQLKNIPGKGFACFFGDDTKNHLVTYKPNGDLLWKKTVASAEAFGLLTTGSKIYLLSKQKHKMLEGGYELQGFTVADTVVHPKIMLQDKSGNQLKILSFESDPLTGKPYIAGNIINTERGNRFVSATNLSDGAYTGVFTININGPSKKDLAEVYSYWGDGSLSPSISKRGKYAELNSYAKYYETVKDAEGNNYFIGSSFVRKPKVGTIISSVLLSPFIVVSPYILLVSGTSKTQIKDAILLKQTPKGIITVEATVPGNSSRYFASRMPYHRFEKRSFYKVVNNDTKTNYLIVDDVKDIVIYNINQKKVARKVARKEGAVVTSIYPAKEGHVMVAEYNRKEKYSKFSIEAL